MRFIIYICALFLILMSCKKNSYIISEDQLVDVLVDIHLAEGVTRTNIRNFVNSKDREAVTLSIFDMHGIEKERFDSTMHYYAIHANAYDQIYERVLQKIMLFESTVKAGEYDRSDLLKMKALIRNDFPEDTLLADSLLRELWPSKRAYDYPQLEKKSKTNFEIFLGDTIKGNAFLLKADILIYPDDSAENTCMKLCVEYGNEMEDEQSILLVKDSIMHNYELWLPVTDTTDIVKIKGALTDYEHCEGQMHSELRNIRLYELIDSGNPLLSEPPSLLNTNL